MTLIDKLKEKVSVLGVIGLSGALLSGGCITSNPEHHEEIENAMNKLTETMTWPLLGFAARNQAASVGDPERAIRLENAARVADALHYHQTQIEAAEAGKSQVNVYTGDDAIKARGEARLRAELTRAKNIAEGIKKGLSSKESIERADAMMKAREEARGLQLESEANNASLNSFAIAHCIDFDKDEKIDYFGKIDCNYFYKNSSMIPSVSERIYGGMNLLLKLKDENGTEMASEGPKKINYSEPGRNMYIFISGRRDVEDLERFLKERDGKKPEGTRRYLFELFVEGEKIPRETKNIIINHSEEFKK